MPTYNRADLMAQTVHSVRQQTYTNWELIVVDDGSTDRTSEILADIADPRILILRMPHSGSLPKVRNAGFDLAKGKYLAMLDSDDLWHPDKLQRQISLLESSPAIRYSFSSGEQIGVDPVDIPTFETQIGSFFKPIVFDQKYTQLTSSLIFDATAIGEIGPMNENWGGIGETDLFFRLAHRYTGAYVGENLVSVRKHSGNHSGEYQSSHDEMIVLYRSYASSGMLTGAQADLLVSRMYRRIFSLHKRHLQKQSLLHMLPQLLRCLSCLLRSAFYRGRAMIRARWDKKR